MVNQDLRESEENVENLDLRDQVDNKVPLDLKDLRDKLDQEDHLDHRDSGVKPWVLKHYLYQTRFLRK